MKKRLISFLLVLVLVISVCPVALAEEAETPDDTIEITEVDLGEELGTAKVSGLKQVYGLTQEDGLEDDDAMVLLIMGDGFTEEELGTFYVEAEKMAKYIMQCSPYDEFTETIKIYALGVVSEESGVTGASAVTANLTEDDVVNTFFGAHYWTGGMQRLVDLSEEGAAKGNALKKAKLSAADFCLYIVNSKVYGGSGGDYCVASLNTSSYEMMLHEMGHTIADLSDEYYAASYADEKYANLTQESDPDKVKWSSFIGKNGIGIYPWGGDDSYGWYIPSLNCKMQYLGAEYEFCEVCKEELRKAFCANSSVTMLFFQTYADEFDVTNPPTDMSRYFILRKGNVEITGDQLSKEKLTLTYYDYYDEDDPGQTSAPTEPGTYWVHAAFSGDTIDGVSYDACEQWGTYTIDAFNITLSAERKVQNGQPAKVDWEVEGYTDAYDDLIGTEYFVKVDYLVSPYNDYATYLYRDTGNHETYDFCYYDYESYDWVKWYGEANVPTEAGEYTVTVSVVDEEGNPIASKSVSYTISIRSNNIINNNSDDYFGTFSYGNNKTVVIYGEGFTLDEQSEFDALAKELTNGILAVEPIKETQLYFNFMSINTVSNESGIGTDITGAKDTFFGLTYDPNTGMIPADNAHCNYPTYYATRLCYNFASTNESAVCIIIVNDDNVTECSTYAPYSALLDDPYYAAYHYYQTIYVTPNDANWDTYAAAQILNYLTLNEPDYRARTRAEKAEQRQELLAAMYYEYDGACAPVIVSRAYDRTFVANGEPVDLTPYFHVYYKGTELPGVILELTYFDADGKVIDAPSEPGTYSVLAETIPYGDDEWDYYQVYQPDGWTDDDALWLTPSRGKTTFTILPAGTPSTGSGSSSGGSTSGSTDEAEESTTIRFVDVPSNAWYKDAVDYVVENGLMDGTGSNKFSPDATLTRGMIVTVLYRMEGEPSVNYTGAFDDVADNQWYTDGVEWAVKNGIVTGYGDGDFGPTDPLTREQMATILYRYAQYKGNDVSVGEDTNILSYTDAFDITEYAFPALQWACGSGIIGGMGDGSLAPQGSATRAQFATILMRFLEQ